MALIKCPECKKKVSELSKNCPNCGYPFNNEFHDNIIETNNIKKDNISKNKRKKSVVLLIVLSIILIIAVAVFLLKNYIFKSSSEKIYEKALPATVEIQVKTKKGTNTGTGFFDDSDGTIITNYHVIEGAYEGAAIIHNGGKFDIEKIIGYDENLDIAIIKIDYTNNKFLSKRSNHLSVGETIYTLGSSEGLTNSFSSGIISAVDREIDGNTFIQITSPISHGNSGGPLIDEKGNVVGITSASISEGQNLNLAIPITVLNDVSRDKDYDFSRFYELTKPNRLTYDEIKNNQYYCGVNFGKYKGTLHWAECELVQKEYDYWAYEKGVINYYEMYKFLQDAKDDGFRPCKECNCLEKFNKN